MNPMIQWTAVSMAVIFAIWQAFSSLLPARRRQAQQAAALWLAAPGHPRLARRLGLALLPAAGGAAGCGEGCSNCNNCKTP